jgi:hypothetical protein
MKKDEDKGSTGLGILRQSIAALGNSFGVDHPKDKMASPKKDKNSSVIIDKKAEAAKKGHRSNGIFDTLFKPLEITRDVPEKVSKNTADKGKPPSGKNTSSMFGIVKDTTNYDSETAGNFFGKKCEPDNRTRERRGTVIVSDLSSMQVSNLTSLEIISFYKDKPKELVKLFHQIGSKTMNSKDNKGSKWISDIVKNFVTLLIYTAYSIEEIKKLDTIKDYFALKIEKIMEEKNDSLGNIVTLQEEIKKEQQKSEGVKEEERKSRIRLMEKSTEFTVRMNELLNIKDEKDQALQLVENSKKKLKEAKRVSKYTPLFYRIIGRK